MAGTSIIAYFHLSPEIKFLHLVATKWPTMSTNHVYHYCDLQQIWWGWVTSQQQNDANVSWTHETNRWAAKLSCWYPKSSLSTAQHVLPHLPAASAGIATSPQKHQWPLTTLTRKNRHSQQCKNHAGKNPARLMYTMTILCTVWRLTKMLWPWPLTVWPQNQWAYTARCKIFVCHVLWS